jgi:hypothetical protein
LNLDISTHSRSILTTANSRWRSRGRYLHRRRRAGCLRCLLQDFGIVRRLRSRPGSARSPA